MPKSIETGLSNQPFDFKNPDIWQAGVPYDDIARIRRATPVYWNEEQDGPGFWSILGFEDIAAISRNPKLFSSAAENGGHRLFNENEVAVASTNSADMGTPFISMDPPTHNQRRSQLLKLLTTAKLDAMSARIRARAVELLDRLTPNEPLEWVQAVSAPFPLMTLVEILNVPQSDWQKLYHWTNALVGEDDADFRASPEDMAERMQAFGEYMAWLFKTRRENPGEDAASMLANADFNGKPVAFKQFLADMVLVTVGGNETVRNSLSHGIIAFAGNPQQWQTFRHDETVHVTAIQEIVRYTSPVLHMRRTAMEDTQVSGVNIKKGSKVVLWYVSGNRDESVFDDPNSFNIRREPNRHLGFGSGQHSCIGQRVAQLQLRIMFEELARRFTAFEIAGKPDRLRSNFINGLKSMQVIAQI